MTFIRGVTEVAEKARARRKDQSAVGFAQTVPQAESRS
jgi:hypothetical protein